MGPRCIRFDNDSINLDNVGKFGLNVAVGWLFVAGRIYGLGGQNCREEHGSDEAWMAHAYFAWE